MNKRGISGVVTAILLILLAIAAVIIVWAVVKPLIEKPAEGAQTDCVTVDLDITNVVSGTSVTIKRNAGAGDVTGIKIVTYDSTGSKTCDVASLAELASDTFISADCTAGGFATGTWTVKVEAYPQVGEQKTICPNGATKSLS